MATFDSIFKLTLGSDLPYFQLTNYQYSDQPIVESGVGERGRSVVLRGEGYVEAQAAAELETRLSATAAGFRVSGVNVVVTGPSSSIEATILAARSIDGGPHVSFEWQPAGAANHRAFKFEAVAATIGDTSSSSSDPDAAQAGVSHGYTIRTATRADGLKTINQSGQITGVATSEFLITTVINRFKADHAWPNWVITHDYETDQSGKSLRYNLTAIEFHGELIRVDNTLVVDGSTSIRTDRDEQQRLVKIYDFDLLVGGDPQVILTAIRQRLINNPVNPLADQLADPRTIIITRESSSVELLREPRLRASFTTLAGADSKLLNWSQSLRVRQAEETWRTVSHPGVAPILVRNSPGITTVVQSGSAVGLGRFPKPGIPINGGFNVEAPEIEYTELNIYEKQTRWTYVMILPDDAFAPDDESSASDSEFTGVNAIGLEGAFSLSGQLARPTTTQDSRLFVKEPGVNNG